MFREQNLNNVFKVALKIALVFLGIIISFLLFRELWYLVEATFSGETEGVFYEIIDCILTFFLFLEFLELIIHYLSHKSHPSITMYIYIAVTSIVRTLISTHDGSQYQVLIQSSAILVLIGGVVLLKKYGDLK